MLQLFVSLYPLFTNLNESGWRRIIRLNSEEDNSTQLFLTYSAGAARYSASQEEGGCLYLTYLSAVEVERVNSHSFWE